MHVVKNAITVIIVCRAYTDTVTIIRQSVALCCVRLRIPVMQERGERKNTTPRKTATITIER